MAVFGQNVPQEFFWQREKDFKQTAHYLVESTGENLWFRYESCRLHAYAQQGVLFDAVVDGLTVAGGGAQILASVPLLLSCPASFGACH